MKRIIAFLAALACAGMLFSCGTDPGEEGSDESSGKVTEEVTEPETEPETGEETTVPEKTETIISAEFSGSPLIRAALRGKFGEDVYIRESRSAVHRDYVGQFGVPVEIGGEFDDGVLMFEYDPENMENVPAENLSLLYYNEDEARYDRIENIRADDKKHTISAKITEPGTYFLFDTGEKAHNTVFKNDEYDFRITIPEEITLRYISGSPLEDDEEGRFKVLLECEKNDNIQVGIEYLQRPGYSGAQEFIGAITDILRQNGTLAANDTITGADGSTGYYFMADFSDENDKAYSINCFYPLSDTEYINIWYGFKDLKYTDAAMASLESFSFTGEYQGAPEEPEPRQEECPFAPEDVVLNLPEGMSSSPGDRQPIPTTDDPDRQIAELYKVDVSGFTGVESVYVEAVKNGVFPATEADAYCESIEGVNGYDLIKRDETDLSNGKKGYILHAETAGSDLSRGEGACFIHGFYDTGIISWSVRVTVVADAHIDQSTKDQLYDFVKNIDIKK